MILNVPHSVTDNAAFEYGSVTETGVKCAIKFIVRQSLKDHPTHTHTLTHSLTHTHTHTRTSPTPTHKHTHEEEGEARE